MRNLNPFHSFSRIHFFSGWKSFSLSLLHLRYALWYCLPQKVFVMITINLEMCITQSAHENGSGNEGNDDLAARQKYPGHGVCHGWALEDASFSASWVSEGGMSPSEKVLVPSMVDQWHCPTGQAGLALPWHGEGGRLEGNTFSLSFPNLVGLAIVTVS